MGQRKQSRADGPNLDAYLQNAQHGQNRAGVDVESNVSFEEFESKVPIDPQAADDRIADEGPEIQARVHALGHDVLGEVEPDEESSKPAAQRPVTRVPARRRSQ